VNNKVIIFFQHIDPLPPIDHSEIQYAPFEKNFYVAHEDIRNLSDDQVNELRHKHGVNVWILYFEI
jgi:ATP-dependent RNA helicase DDX42